MDSSSSGVWTSERGHDVTLIAAEGSKAGESEVFEVISPTWGKRAEVEAFKKYKERLNGFDVIIDNSHYHYALRKEEKRKLLPYTTIGTR